MPIEKFMFQSQLHLGISLFLFGNCVIYVQFAGCKLQKLLSMNEIGLSSIVSFWTSLCSFGAKENLPSIFYRRLST